LFFILLQNKHKRIMNIEEKKLKELTETMSKLGVSKLHISKQIGVKSETFYRYFSTKENGELLQPMPYVVWKAIKYYLMCAYSVEISD
jgi:hypothetical protein